MFRCNSQLDIVLRDKDVPAFLYYYAKQTLREKRELAIFAEDLLQDQNGRIKEKDRLLEAKDKLLSEKDKRLSEKDQFIKHLQNAKGDLLITYDVSNNSDPQTIKLQFQAKDDEIASLKSQLMFKESSLQLAEHKYAEKVKESESLAKRLANKEASISSLKAKILTLGLEVEETYLSNPRSLIE